MKKCERYNFRIRIRSTTLHNFPPTISSGKDDKLWWKRKLDARDTFLRRVTSLHKCFFYLIISVVTCVFTSISKSPSAELFVSLSLGLLYDTPIPRTSYQQNESFQFLARIKHQSTHKVISYRSRAPTVAKPNDRHLRRLRRPKHAKDNVSHEPISASVEKKKKKKTWVMWMIPQKKKQHAQMQTINKQTHTVHAHTNAHAHAHARTHNCTRTCPRTHTNAHAHAYARTNTHEHSYTRTQ